MTIAAELARLAAIEALAPTAALEGLGAFPTLAGSRIYDSRKPAIDDIDRDEDFTPVVSVFTRKSESPRRGQGQGNVSRFGRTTLEFVVELAVLGTEDEVVFVDALAADDPQARLVLSALCAQIRRTLFASPLFRRAVMAVDGIEEEGFAVPELGLRWHRTTLLYDCQIPDDEFPDAGGLPQPAAALIEAFPPTSYAVETMARMAATFAGTVPFPQLERVAFAVKVEGVSGQIGSADSVAPPFAEIEE